MNQTITAATEPAGYTVMNLEDYGYCDFFSSQIDIREKEAGLVPARVISIQRECYRIVSGFGEQNARLKGAAFYQNAEIVRYPSVGDFVLVKPNPAGDAVLFRVLDRRSCFSRHNPSPTAVSNYENQIVASNFDYVFIMTSLNKDFNLKRLDRYAASAWQSGATPVICLTKADLCESVKIEALRNETAVRFPGIDIVTISALTGYGLDSLTPYLKSGTTLCFLGSSGIGKSTLLNALAGEELMKTTGIREDDSKGHHTTTHRELFRLTNGVLIIDTPGMRELGMWEADDGLSLIFSDIDELASQCRFVDCRHETEPGCAVRKAIAEGMITESRLISYRKLLRESKHAEKKAAMLKAKMENALKAPKTKDRKKTADWESEY